jgi:ubiquinone/menaquinone biosynthesis C-methylase UbiE
MGQIRSMAATADDLQKVFKTLSDPTRLRILRLLEKQELVVQELMEVLGMAQSRVSRHLAILREAGLLSDRRDRTFVSYRFIPPVDRWWRDAWNLVRDNLAGDSTTERDDAALARMIEAREKPSRNFFDSVGPEWDALRKIFNDDVVRAQALTRLVMPDQLVADIGTGTGILASELARLGLRVIAVDGSQAMLDAAQSKLEEAGLLTDDRVVLRRGDADALPLHDDEVDAAFAHMMMQYLSTPLSAIQEMVRVVRPGGLVVVVDFVAHELDWMRQELSVKSLGFELDDVRGWFASFDLEDIRLEVQQPTTRARDLPSTFIVSGRKARSA